MAVLTAWRWTQWLRLAAGVLTRRRTDRVAYLACRELLVRASRGRPWEVDGEVLGVTRTLRVSVAPGNLLVRVPPPAR